MPERFELIAVKIVGDGAVKADFRYVAFYVFAEAAERVRVGVGKRQIGLYIINRSAVQYVRALDYKHRPVRSAAPYFNEPDARKSEGVRTKRRTGGKYAHSRVSSESRRTDGKTRGLLTRFGKFPDKPEVGISFYTAYCVVGAERFFKYYHAFVRGYAALTRYTELGRKVRPYFCNGSYFHFSTPFKRPQRLHRTASATGASRSRPFREARRAYPVLLCVLYS